MIGWLSGELMHREFDRIVVAVHGVGYDLAISVRTLESLPAPGQAVELWVHTNVREDAIDLYGFSSIAERSVFRQLLTVGGIGSRIALAAVSRFSPSELFQAITGQDVKALSQVPGIGKKTAQRIILDLADKIEISGLDAERVTREAPVSGVWGQLEAALRDLGFKTADVDKTVATLKRDDEDEDRDVQELLKAALRLLKS